MGTAPTPRAARLGYRPALDGVRALAVLMVVATHASYVLVPEWAGWVAPGGFLGVDVFFVLSGFLITSLLFQEHEDHGRLSIRHFYRRRILRLVPAVAVLLIVHFALAVAIGADLGLEGRTVAAVAAYVLNWVIAAGKPAAVGLGHLWSLSVEEQFYLVWPLLLAAVLRCRRPERIIAGIAAAGVLWATGVRVVLWLHGTGWEAVYVRTDARMDELLMGAVLALGFRRGWSRNGVWRRAGPMAAVILIVCAVVVPRDSSWLYVGGGFTVVGIASAVLIAAVLEPGSRLHDVLAWRPAVGLGRASYSLYLWHVPVFFAVADHLGGLPIPLRLGLGLLGTAIATLASYRLVEIPVARLRRRPSPQTLSGGLDDGSRSTAQPVENRWSSGSPSESPQVLRHL